MSDSLLSGDAGGAPADVNTNSTTGGQPDNSGFTAPEWANGFEIEQDLLADPSLKAIKDVPSLIKSYVHAQRKMGADKIVLPSKNSTKEEWLGLYHKLGLPTEFDQYSFNGPENPVFNEELINQFKQTAYENNLLPDQAAAVLDFLNNYTAQEAEKLAGSQEESLNQAINGLKEEWGEAFDQNLRKAKLAVMEFGGDDLKEYLNNSGLGNDPQLIKAFSKIGDSFFKEDKFGGEGKPAYAMSPDEAQAAINKIMGDFNGPYFNASHPDHNRMVNEVNKLYQMTSRK